MYVKRLCSRWSLHANMWQNAANSVERDENFVPRLRSDYSLPPKGASQPLNYREVFEETPLYTLGRMLAMQLLGWQAYLLQNTLGSPAYPAGTNVSSIMCRVTIDAL